MIDSFLDGVKNELLVLCLEAEVYLEVTVRVAVGPTRLGVDRQVVLVDTID